MDQQRERIEADLRGLLAGQVFCDDFTVQMYSTDASIYQVRPLGVVRPRGVADVRALVRYAAENSISLHARGAGTGLAGESLGPGLVVDFSQAMRRIVSLDQDTVTVQPGVVLGQLNRYLASFGKQFGPSPATGGVTTMGSVLALDNSGSNWLRHGSARRHILSMQVVLADGESMEVAKHRVTDDPVVDPSPRRRELVRRLAELIQRESRVIQSQQPKSCVNRVGYHLHDVLENGQLDLARLLVGSEGTLALITQATLRIVPIPKHRALMVVFFDRLESAVQAAMDAAALGLASCDLMDRRILTLARDTDPRYAAIIPRDAEAMLLVEQQSDDAAEVVDSLQQVAMHWQRKRRLAFDTKLVQSPDDCDALRRMARRVSPTLYRVAGPERPTPFIEDIAVPPDRLADFVVRMQNTLKAHQVTASLFAHAGHGQLHVRPFLNLADPAHVRKMHAIASELYQQVLDVGGTISGEHGCGLSRTWFVKRQCGPLYDVLREVKRIFDPQNLLNPGKVVADVPQPLVKNLRSFAAAGEIEETTISLPSETEVTVVHEPPGRMESPLELHLAWNEPLPMVASECNGCGRCRTQSPEMRMCPIFRMAPAEEASPRAKANLLQSFVAGQLDVADLTKERFKNIADLCVNCHQCRLECPAAVDIPKLMIESKAQYVAGNGLDTTDWILSRLDWVSRWGSRLMPIANWILRTRWTRWLMEKATGIAQGRKLPRLASSSFLRRAEKRRLTRPTRRVGTKVLYFVDVYANYYDVKLAESFVSVLEHNGIAVYVPAEQLQSGMAKISLGDVERARPLVAQNVAMLADAVRQGYTIVATEPSAALCLTHEYPTLLDDDDAKLVAANTKEACQYLWEMHATGRLELDFKPLNITVGHHVPCHQRALSDKSFSRLLLGLLKGVTVKPIERGCSGMAGTFGLRRDNYRTSLRAGFGLIAALRDPSIEVGVTECSSCKMQMEQGTTKPTIHPIKLLALAYGLHPEFEQLLTSRSEELVVT
ncbi:D-lactate dehydrogenase (cytochrome) [Pirellula staleyi DSM 6068]|uniref:D-lactate dehydrogenase (Cytochrome) n=1 Tax=Pirellula staleyi (strain ATCC 27377 / DSM 6068 / ICPB 4128) TaxID=530564 RepID=D2R3Q8_PIRSD|nr:FAD-binding and (Fe-S)-binding domain-containing protein [Pirellula staleyi]ADB17012.1 D-lactate dehydrogenase (cytochrome) [Pirellula staleyi DSM 6068]